MSVIVGRALPDVRDGLKPVHRRILYAMDDLGLASSKPFRKCARVVGEVLGKYHPHGDQAVYDSMVRMAQPFAMGEILVDGHGNFGSIDNDPAAAMRFASSTTMFVLADIPVSSPQKLPISIPRGSCTPTETKLCTTPWSAWLNRSQWERSWWTATVTLAPSTTIPPQR